MLFNGSNAIDAQKAKARLDFLIKKGKVFDITEKSPSRSLAANAYLHVILAYFGTQTGNTLDYVKTNYYKRLCNKELYVRIKNDPYIGQTEYLRSSAALTQEEMSLSIDRFRNWSASEAGIYIPSSDEWLGIVEMQKEIERDKNFL